MYFPHQFDFRGRAYSVPNFLNYQTVDLSKGLLQFAESKPFTDRGIFWFLKAGKNLWGSDEPESPESWVRRHKDQIHSSASDPKGYLWWSEAEKPWQFLAWVFEASSWLKGNLRETRLPIAIDASSNGLQIMSMLSKYKEGAIATNCVSKLSSPPMDIYKVILKMTKYRLEGNVLGSQWISLGLDRKLIKSIIMTIPYGITKFRATELILKWYWNKDQDIFGKKAGSACKMLANLIIDTFYKNYPDFRKLMDFLEGLDTPRLWQSPSGFPVLQYYHKAKLKKLRSLLFGRIRSFNYFDDTDEVDVAKMKRAFTPNFIHSLDAAVMHLALSRFNGSCVAAVHDSFATHASEVDALLQTLKDANADVFGASPKVFWEKIFSEKPLEKQAFEALLVNYSSITGDLVVDEIRHSAYMYR
jgi:DNA-directed RNA polymerase